MELYRNTPASVLLELPMEAVSTASNVVVRARNEAGVYFHEFGTVTLVNTGTTGFSVSIPWHLLRTDQDFFIDWSLDYTEHGISHTYKESMYVQVVSPILPFEEISRIAAVAEENDVRDLEHRVRYAIQTYTGQNFGRYTETISIPGTGSDTLILPAPLLALHVADFPTASVRLINDGCALRGGTTGWYGIKHALPEYANNFYYSEAPITLGSHVKFVSGRYYNITGLWGYNDIPGDVKQAARMLIADYSADESLWRDRYIDSVRSGNWRFEVNASAFLGTGNVVADQILESYRSLTLAMV